MRTPIETTESDETQQFELPESLVARVEVKTSPHNVAVDNKTTAFLNP